MQIVLTSIYQSFDFLPDEVKAAELAFSQGTPFLLICGGELVRDVLGAQLGVTLARQAAVRGSELPLSGQARFAESGVHLWEQQVIQSLPLVCIINYMHMLLQNLLNMNLA